jgi:hypothetical protein
MAVPLAVHGDIPRHIHLLNAMRFARTPPWNSSPVRIGMIADTRHFSEPKSLPKLKTPKEGERGF